MGRARLLSFPFLLLVLSAAAFSTGSEALPSAGTLVRQYASSLVKWATSSSSSPRIPHSSDGGGDAIQFESGYLVETLVEGKKLGVEPHTIRVSPDGELFAVDSVNSNIVRITPPLSQYSRARLVAGSFQGYSGHVDGKPSDCRFHHPRGVAMDDGGNVYVADTLNLAIRKIGDAGVTTIAGGKSNVAGYRDGPGEDAKFSNDFDVVYVGSTCSLLVIDRGNAAMRQISLPKEDCNYRYSSISTSDVIMVASAVLVGYVSCFLHRGFGSSVFEKLKDSSAGEFEESGTMEKPKLHVEALKEDIVAGWPSFGRLVLDLSRSAVEAFCSAVLSLIPGDLFFWRSKKGLTSPRNHVMMPQVRKQPHQQQKQMNSLFPSETVVAPDASSTFTPKPQKVIKLPAFKDPTSVSTKHRTPKRQDIGDLYGNSEVQQVGSKVQKDRMRHRHHDRSEVSFSNAGNEQKVSELKPINYADAKFDHPNLRNKFGMDGPFKF